MLDNKEKELTLKLKTAEENSQKMIENKTVEFDRKIKDLTMILDKKNKTVAELEVKLVETDKKMEKARKECLELKTYQRKLEEKMVDMEEEVMMSRAEMKTQTVIKNTMAQKLQNIQNELYDKNETIDALKKELLGNADKISTITAENDGLRSENENINKDILLKSQKLENL